MTDEENGAYRELFERSADAILIIEGETFVDCNAATVQMLRCKEKADVLRTHPSELSPPTQPDGRPSFEKANEMIDIAFARGSHRFEWMHKRADGEVFPVEVLLTAVQESRRPVLHVVWRDITDRKKLEDELHHAQKMQAVGRLAGGIAHDFNNLLVAILGHSEFLLEGLEHNPEMLEHAEEIRSTGERAADLVKQLLAFGRKQRVKPVVLDLNVAVTEVRKLLERLIGEDIALSMSLADHALPIRADRAQLDQIVLNLVTNARDAMPDGGQLSVETKLVQVGEGTVGLETQVSAGRYAQLAVVDGGQGMSAEVERRAIEPFFTTKPDGRGTGLGLSTVHDIIEQYGGSLTLYTAPGHGTTVKVMLPLSSETPIPIQEEDSVLIGGSETILIVEDESAVASVVLKVLKDSGYNVLLARDGQAALDVYLENATRIDMILSDVITPHLTGPGLLNALEERGHRPVALFMSGYTSDVLTRYEGHARTIGLIEKPFSRAALLHRVRRTLDER